MFDLWVMMVFVVWLFDIVLLLMLNYGCFDFGFYVGCVYGFVVLGVVLFVMLFENGWLYV